VVLDVAALNRRIRGAPEHGRDTSPRSRISRARRRRPAPEAPKYVQKLDKQGRAYATGKRKDAVARVWIKPGSGKITSTSRDLEVYFARPVLRMMLFSSRSSSPTASASTT
jgi:hypothetical protein